MVVRKMSKYVPPHDEILRHPDGHWAHAAFLVAQAAAEVAALFVFGRSPVEPSIREIYALLETLAQDKDTCDIPVLLQTKDCGWEPSLPCNGVIVTPGDVHSSRIHAYVDAGVAVFLNSWDESARDVENTLDERQCWLVGDEPLWLKTASCFTKYWPDIGGHYIQIRNGSLLELLELVQAAGTMPVIVRCHEEQSLRGALRSIPARKRRQVIPTITATKYLKPENISAAHGPDNPFAGITPELIATSKLIFS